MKGTSRMSMSCLGTERVSDVAIFPYSKPWVGGPEHESLPTIGRIVDQKTGLPNDTPPKISKHLKEKLMFNSGCYLYGGPFFDHFGHSIVDSSVRLYGFDEKLHSGVIFPILKKRFNGVNIPDYFKDILSFYNVPEEKVIFLAEPAIFETVDYVRPKSYESIKSGPLIDPCQIDRREAFLARNRSNIELPYSKNIYLGRSHILDKGTFAGESYISQLLKSVGYCYVKPEEWNLADQIRILMRSENIILVEGSSIYPIDFIGEKIKSNIFFIPRRSGGKKLFSRVLNQFTNSSSGTESNVLRLENISGKMRPNSISILKKPRTLVLELENFLDKKIDFNLSCFFDVESKDIGYYYRHSENPDKFIKKFNEIRKSFIS